MKKNLSGFLPFVFISFVIISAIYLWGPTDIFFKNAAQLPYNYIALFKHIFIKTIIYTCLLSVFLYALSFIKVFDIGGRVIPAASAIALILCMNGLLFKVSGVMDGSEHIDIFSFTSILNTAAALVLISLSLIFYKFINEKKLYKPICFIILFANIASTVFSINSSVYKPIYNGTSKVSLEAGDIMQLSDKRNIVYIVLDTFDGSYMDKILYNEADGDKYAEMFKDFTYFPNYSSIYPWTWATGLTQFAGAVYKNEIPFNEFAEKVLNSDKSLFSILSERGWRNILYMEGNLRNYVYQINGDLLYNSLPPSDPNMIGSEKAGEITGLSLYKVMPFILKNGYKKIQMKTSNSGKWDFNFLNMVKNNSFQIGETPVFSLIHLKGAHPPYIVNEDIKLADNATFISQARASLKLTDIIIKKMKEAGVYDNSLIIVAADHGNVSLRSSSLLLIKMPYDNMTYGGGIRVNKEPVTQLQMRDIMLSVLDGSVKKAEDIKSEPERYFYHYVWIDDWDQYYLPPMTIYKIPNDVKDYENYVMQTVLNPNQEQWADSHNKYVFPEDFDKVPKGTLGKNWTNTKEGAIGRKNIWIKLPDSKEKVYNIKIIADMPKGAKNNSIKTTARVDNNVVIRKNIDYDKDKQIDIRVFDADLITVYFKEKIVLKSIEITPDENMSVRYDNPVNFDDILKNGKFYKGFYGVEGDFIWSGGKNTIKLLPPADTDKDLNLEFFMKPLYVRDNKPQQVTFSIDGSVIDTISLPDTNIRLYKTVIPKEFLKQGEIISLDIDCLYTDSPFSLSGSNDNRQLGAAFYSPEYVFKDIRLKKEEVTPVSELSRFFLSGWYGNEETHIWSGGGNAELLIPVNSGDKVLSLEIGAYIDKAGTPKTIAFSAGGKILAEYTVNDGAYQTYDINIPEDITGGVMILTINSSYAASPKEQENISDDRELGIKLKSVRILGDAS